MNNFYKLWQLMETKKPPIIEFGNKEYITEMFVQPTNVPESIVLAVYHILNEKATADDWEMLDKYIAETSLEQVLEWVRKILERNPHHNLQSVETELQWFKKELTRSGGEEN